ncbi:MAG: hypothetical protein IPK60_01495 [Sandaracinaceae bacterium]|nr:hypothetical protein [Sandaracinaceae bacterium]
MNRRRILPLAFFCAAALVAGCTIFASKSEYADYRAVRTAGSERDRVLAMHTYVANNPHGQWFAGIQAERMEMEQAVYDASKTTRAGLEFYLEAYPDGTFVEQARPRLAAFQTVQGRRDVEAGHAREVQATRRQSQEEQRRTWVTRAVTYWGRTLFSITNWGQPIAQVAGLNPAFSRAFGENPAPRCTENECVKYYQNVYAIPVPGATRIDRTIQIVLRLKMESMRVVRAEVLLPSKGFSRWYEMENRTIVTDEDPTQREQAVNWALERLDPMIREGFTGSQPLEGFTLEAISALPFAFDGTRTGTSTPGSGGADDGEAGAEEESPTPAPTPTPAPQATTPATAADAGTTGPSVEDLLGQAAGVDNTQPAPTPEAVPTPEVTATPEGPIAPRVVRAFSTAALRTLVFVAADEDYGTAYDGVVIELNRAAPAASATTPARGGRGGAARPAPRPRPAH